jgi:putative ABC transport system permease protein
MIALVLAMVWTRRAQAVTLALLSMFAVAAAVAAPAYLRAADRAVAAGQVRTATPAERGLTISGQQDDRNDQGNGEPRFADFAAALTKLPGFDYVYAAEYSTIGLEKDIHYRTRLVYRQDACAHLTLLRGRCLIGEGDVVVGEQTAKRYALRTGDQITLRFATFNDDIRTPIYLADGAPAKLTVVGVYRVPAPDSTYWGTHGYFAAYPGDRPGEPVFTDTGTMGAMDHGLTAMSIDGTAGPGALAVDRLTAMRSGLDAVRGTAVDIGAAVTLDTSIPDLLDRIDSGRSAAHLIVPVLAVPLVLLACLSIFLAVGYGTEGRRPELAVVALRGARWGQRWWLATGENLIAIVVGAVLGCLAGQLLVNAVAAGRFPGVGADAGFSSLRYAPFAALAALVAAVLAERRQLLSPVAELLRRAPTVPAGARALAVEAAVALLAVVAGGQLGISHGALSGVGTFAAALIVIAMALLAARALLPVVTRLAARALRRNRLGLALAGFQLSRRPGAARLFALLVATVAVAGYAACATDVAAQGRVVQAQLGTGAARVVEVAPVDRSQLLTAVRAVDPAGDFAMAVVRQKTRATDPRILAVDSSRLPTTAFWLAGATDPAEVARRLRPAAPDPLLIPGQDVTVDAIGSGLDPGKPIGISVVLSSLAGHGDAVVQLGELRNGLYEYQQRAAVCRDGCRLNGFQFSTARGITALTGQVTITALRTVNPSREAVPPARLADATGWRAEGLGKVTPATDGLRIDIDAAIGLTDGLFVLPVDTPFPMPVAEAGTSYAKTADGLDGRPMAIDRIAHLPAVPAAGDRAMIFDLEYADRLSLDASPADGAQVWLNAKAPADVLDRLEAHGLVVVHDTRADQVRRQLDQQGPALALWFYVLAGCLAVALAAGALILAATVDRARRVEDLSALRGQGLSRAALRQATLWTYPVLVAIAVLAGLVIALLGWWLTGWALPLAGLDPPPVPLPGWPRAYVVAATGLVVLVVLAAVAYLAGRRTLKEIA